MYHYTECGLQNVMLTNGYQMVDTPYGKGVSVHDVEGLHRAIGYELATNKPRLTGAEVRFLRNELDLPQVELARFLGVSEVSIRGWENHRTKITKPSERLLRRLYLEHIDGDGTLRELVESISKIIREAYQQRISMRETSEGWQMAA